MKGRGVTWQPSFICVVGFLAMMKRMLQKKKGRYGTGEEGKRALPRQQRVSQK